MKRTVGRLFFCAEAVAFTENASSATTTPTGAVTRTKTFVLTKPCLKKLREFSVTLRSLTQARFLSLTKNTWFYQTGVQRKKINTIHFEAHYLYRNKISQLRKDFADFDLKMKLGLETFDCDFRENVLKKESKRAVPLLLLRISTKLISFSELKVRQPKPCKRILSWD